MAEKSSRNPVPSSIVEIVRAEKVHCWPAISLRDVPDVAAIMG